MSVSEAHGCEIPERAVGFPSLNVPAVSSPAQLRAKMFPDEGGCRSKKVKRAPSLALNDEIQRGEQEVR